MIKIEKGFKKWYARIRAHISRHNLPRLIVEYDDGSYT